MASKSLLIIIFITFLLFFSGSISAKIECHGNCNLDFDNCYNSYQQNPSNSLFECIGQWNRCTNKCGDI
ncbi:hypothetical protein DDB_G0275901 [Dictyostelium discoideum AX4]|uniref:Uncharacterized protein n=1 Tax=Dictyostelium discoideum TaxID=44689 RepID=Q552V6_DICDI|nr:hypothetical protein DDB_G0275901 [Dictyostelium discoideum AX4]EAL69701.1 hypothetical protein DDB_G0275901 [Dictyostelium discoideum AX4]|eukprot:XP_643575.1 hypothetical protein DDB_G0275901 [Dictyostelium discoideum AX4]